MAETIEAPPPPEWLHKLESRREKIRNKLGHEIGHGSLCLVCGPTCPGLDLHFWRKICINCKCRKDQHDCPNDDDISGWAQFEILGAIRSKPAFMKISQLAEEKPVKLDWVPPNVPADLASDYMKELSIDNIPISGSDAATKRKQQLEMQVPPHDLDATLCHNLTAPEAEQLEQYVKNIKENCSGQANVVRMGANRPVSTVASLPQFTPVKTSLARERIVDQNLFRETPKQICKDKTMYQILNSEVVQNVLQHPARILPGTEVFTSDNYQQREKPLSPDFMFDPNLTDKNKYKLKNMAINTDTIQSALENRDFYDKLLENMKNLKVKYESDPVLSAIDKFRKEYLTNDAFRKNINEFADQRQQEAEQEQLAAAANVFHSPLPLKQFSHTAGGGRLMYQDTPMRKIKFDSTGKAVVKPKLWDIYDDNGQLLVPTVQKDQILSTVLNSDVVRGILHNPAQILASPGTKLQISNAQISPDFMETPYLMHGNKEKLKNMHVNNQMVHSALQHPIVYEKLFDDFGTFQVNYADDTVLTPLKQFTDECKRNPEFRQEMNDFGNTLGRAQIGDGMQLLGNGDYANQINPSRSNDSGFGSVPPTPNFATYPGMMGSEAPEVSGTPNRGQPYAGSDLSGNGSRNTTTSGSGYPDNGVFGTPNRGSGWSGDTAASGYPVYGTPSRENPGSGAGINNTGYPMPNTPGYESIEAVPGHFTEIPGIADLNMYPQVAPNQIHQNPYAMDSLIHGVGNVGLHSDAATKKIPVLKCKECSENIMLGDVAVKAERAGNNIAWHPQCFKCHTCSELLADLVYFFHEGHVYCARDLAAILEIPRCKACDELIFTKEYTAAEGATFHVKHFCCYQCDKALAGSQYIPDEKTKMPCCLKCYDDYFSEKCQSCGQGIGPSEQGVSWGEVHWHGKCFLCAGQNCGKVLIGGRFCVKNKLPFCSPQCVKSIIF